MLFARITGTRVFGFVAAIALTGAACAAHQGDTPQATAVVNDNQVLAPGTKLNVGQGTYVVPALPPASNTVFALTGEETAQPWQPPEGYWVPGINGTVFIPPTR